MKLAELSASDLERAIAIYLEEAYGPAALAQRMPKLPDTKGRSADVLLPPKLGLFTHEAPKKLEPFDPRAPPTKKQPQERMVDQYWLRLGNPRYSMMKLVLGEHLIVGEYFLYVDAHDWMFEADPNDRDEKKALEELRADNARLKERIERRWNAEKLPTLLDLTAFLSSAGPHAAPPKNLRILVVDDDRIAARTLAAFLVSRGYDVELAHDGEEGLRMADPQRHQLVILDVDMPKKNGFVVCTELKTDRRRMAMPVLLSSQRPLGETPPAGANAFLIKPFQADVLLYFVSRLLGER
jgi:CheY-like chemotaxis protein